MFQPRSLRHNHPILTLTKWVKWKENLQLLFNCGLAEICFVTINSGNWVGISPWSSPRKVVAERVNRNEIKETKKHADQDQWIL